MDATLVKLKEGSNLADLHPSQKRAEFKMSIWQGACLIGRSILDL